MLQKCLWEANVISSKFVSLFLSITEGFIHTEPSTILTTLSTNISGQQVSECRFAPMNSREYTTQKEELGWLRKKQRPLRLNQKGRRATSLLCLSVHAQTSNLGLLLDALQLKAQFDMSPELFHDASDTSHVSKNMW